ncbi:MFS transporter [Umezawaea beigongshangensis]|uniref:MFS transporter n=1 Tax=Umezawaea beigongshangensis TaxID=2780383 RepID=UPI0018F25F3A|nr:MFS transporter [Umezawaea beigongshangensis]
MPITSVLYLASGALSLLGNLVAGIALPLLVLVRTGDVTAAGVVAAAVGLPTVAAAVFGGIVVDRWGRRRVSIGADLASAASVSALPLVDALWGLDLAAFVVLGVVGALFDLPGMTAREALLPDVAAASGTPLERLSGLREGVQGVLMVVGPLAGGALVVLLPGSAVLWVTAACSAAAAGVTALLPRGTAPSPAPRRGGWWADLREGGAVLRRDPVLSGLTALSSASVLVMAPLVVLLLPAHLVATGTPGRLGPLVAASAVGGLLGAIVYVGVGRRLSRRTWLVGCTAGAAVMFTWFASLPSSGWMLLAIGLLGLVSGPLAPLVAVITAERVPEDARGRVLGLQNAAALLASPAGMLCAGLLVGGVGLRATALVLAGVWVVLTAGALLLPGLRSLEVTGADHR